MANRRPARRTLLASTTVMASLALVLSGTTSATATTATTSATATTATTTATTATTATRHHSAARTLALPAGLQPEGITSGPGTTYYVGSLNDGRIVTGDLRRGTSRVLLAGATGRQIRGLAFDPRSRLVWAVGNVGTVAHVWAVDSRRGTVVRDVVVPGGVFLNDLVVTADAVWVTDSQVDRLTRLSLRAHGAPGWSAPRFVALRGAWPQVAEGIRANGIRELGPGHVVLDHSTAGGLWDVALATGRARPIRVSGGPAIVSGDGLERQGSTLWVVRGTDDASVAQLRLVRRHGSWSARFTARLTDPTLDVPSTATIVGSSLWVVNARFGVPSPETAAYALTRLRTC